ncbi:MAG: hypothetical protein M1402_01095 [Candidatus Thermoplasmatota archaeon]|nr:hypothetical protein [Candidatus Thermoplasmatota archaeon]
MPEDGNMEKNCIFYDSGNCYLCSSYVTKCSFCFNFSSVASKLKKKGNIYTMFDYLKDEGSIDALFPTGSEKQETLRIT